MKKLVALALVLVTVLSLCSFACAEENNYIIFEPTLTLGMQDKFGITDAAGWMTDDMKVAIVATLLPMDMILSDDVTADITDYKVAYSYVGISDSNSLLVAYRKENSRDVLLVYFDPVTRFGLMTESTLTNVVTDSQLNSAMASQCVSYKKVDEATAQQVAEVILEALEGN